MNRASILATGVLISLSGTAPVSAQALYGAGYAYGPGAPYAYAPFGYGWVPGRCPTALPNRPINASRMRAPAVRSTTIPR